MQPRTGPSIVPDDRDPDRTKKKAFVSVLFECCHVYAHVHRNRAGTHYVGWCPRCARKVQLKIGPGGTDNRIFRAE